MTASSTTIGASRNWGLATVSGRISARGNHAPPIRVSAPSEGDSPATVMPNDSAGTAASAPASAQAGRTNVTTTKATAMTSAGSTSGLSAYALTASSAPPTAAAAVMR